jgi:hypothetical protein
VIFISPFRDGLATLLWFVFAAALGGFLYLGVKRKTLGAFLSELDRLSAHSAETGVTREALAHVKGVEKTWNSAESFFEKEKREDGTEVAFLPESKKKKAEYLMKKSASSWKATLLSVAALYACLVALYYLLPIVLPGYFGNL